MALLAGPVFPEWYWTPLFLTIMFGPPILLLATGGTFIAGRIARRRGIPFGRGRRLGVALALILLLGSLVPVGLAIKRRVEFSRRVEQALPAIDFTPLTPVEELPGYEAIRVAPVDTPSGSYLSWTYRGPDQDHVFVAQQRVPNMTLEPPGHCDIAGLEGRSSNYYDGPCRAVTTSSGRKVHLVRLPAGPGDKAAFVVEVGTLVWVDYRELDEDVLLTYLDRLEPGTTSEIDFVSDRGY